MHPLTVFSPAKLNLFLAITGRRQDGYHELVSVAVPVDFGDRLHVQETGMGSLEAGGPFTLECDDPTVTVDDDNLVLRAANAFSQAAGWPGGAHFRLEKRIPVGAGLGGGSSNAVAALRALNELAGGPLNAGRLAEVAAALGSDCPLFLHGGPVVMRGRGERIESLPPAAVARLSGRRVLMFKPGLGISTAWAYARMAAEAPGHYLPAATAEARLAGWLAGEISTEEFLFNSMEGVAFAKYLALPMLLEVLRDEFGLAARMSGSGSACFALLPDVVPAARVAAIVARIRGLWGGGALVTEAKIV